MAKFLALGFSLVDQTKLVTAASELARNTYLYGLGGTVRLETVFEGAKRGLRLTFEDQGPGIPDIERAMRDGHMAVVSRVLTGSVPESDSDFEPTD